MKEFITEYPTYSRKPYPLKTYLGGIPILPILTAIIPIVAAGSWFTQSTWAEEIAGKWETWDEPTGGILAELEAQTGSSYPELRRMRKEVFEAYSKFKHAAPWDKAKTAKTYQTRVQEFSKAIQREAEAYQREVSPLGAVTALGEAIASPEWWKKYLPWMGTGIATIILIIILTKRKS